MKDFFISYKLKDKVWGMPCSDLTKVGFTLAIQSWDSGRLQLRPADAAGDH